MPSTHINPKIAVTIDGFAGAGKGTLANRLAEHYRLKYLDTGRLYRAVGWLVLEQGGDPDDDRIATEAARNLDFDFRHVGNNKFGSFIGGQDVTADLYKHEVGNAAFHLAKYPSVRLALRDFQQNFATVWRKRIGVVLDGRDTGTVICPDAEVKFFLDAPPEVRAQRRADELEGRGYDITQEKVYADLVARDNSDAANTRPAPDAIVLDSSKMTADEVFAKAVEVIDGVLEGKSA